MRLAGLRALAAVCAPAAALGIGLLAPGTAAAVETAPDAAALTAEATLTGVSPGVLTPDDDGITLTGTVTNTGDEPMGRVQALPRFSTNRVESRDELRAIGTDEELYWGSRESDGFDPIADTLEPGQAETFTVTLSRQQLGFDADGVYVVGVDILATTAEGERARVTTSRTVVPWIQSPDELPSVPVAMLWPLAARPSLLPDGTLTDETLAEQLAADQSLTAVLEAAAEAPVTWAVDPDLLDTVSVLADGYSVTTPEGSIEGSQANTDAALAWRERFDQVTQDADVWMLPYALPDVGALDEHDPALATALTQESLAASETAAEPLPSATSGVAWLDGGSVTEGVLTTLADAGTETVVVPSGAVQAADDEASDDEAGEAASGENGALGQVSAGDHTLSVVAADAGLSSAITDAAAADDPTAGAVDLQQRWIAETAMVALAAAADDTEPPLLVAAPPLRWRPADPIPQSLVTAWTSSTWVEPVGLTDRIDAGEAPEVTPAPSDGTALLPEANVAATAQLRDDTTQYTTLLADPEDVTTALDHATLRSASTGWRDNPETGVSYARGIGEGLTQRIEQVSITVPESVTLSSRAGAFPLTVTNDLPEAVNVRLEVHSENPDRLRVTEIETQEMAPGEQKLVEVTAEAAANGRVPIEVQLTTNDGQPIGPPVATVVNATEYGTIGWVIVGGAGALFLGAIVRRTLRNRRPRRRRRRRSDPPAPADGSILDELPTEARPTQEATR
ncbi:DUF6049 family protein [Jiangella alkaliphila]|uniref:Uncharacterized protein n=1 Tax=Jiangella alkaliphila TaxID=419479 RepID=A0A1H2HLV3_9ACTN|nr:DUF6049 family protein [Jiangella alkaliphila]SDU32861.1 hypothetical protein SAMN04488563_1122 [Jiangella alkaliphila]